MKFVFLSYHYSPDINTPEAWVSRIDFYVGSLECLSKTNTVIRVDQINYEGNFVHNSVQYFFVKATKKKNFFPLKLHKFIKNLKPDIVIISSFHFPIQLIQLSLILGEKVKIIVQNHAEKPFRGIKKYLQRLADKFIDAYFFAASAIGAKWVSNGNIGSQKKIYEIMEGSSVFYPVDKLFAKSKTQISGDPVFLWAGRLNENKDPLTVVKAFLKFSAIHPSARLYMIYQTTELLNQVKNVIAENKNYNNSIVLLGAMQHAEMLYWFNSADFLISGSHYEGSGIVVCEAMSCGCVPIVTNIPSFRTITANGDCGFLYEPGNEKALLDALLKTREVDLQEKRKKALQHFEKHLSFKAIAEDLSAIAEKLVSD